MPKLKTNRGAAKRFKKTASGSYKCKHSHLNHILTKKSTSRKRSLRSPDTIEKVDVPMVKKLLPYSNLGELQWQEFQEVCRRMPNIKKY